MHFLLLWSGCHSGCATCDGIAKDNCKTCRDSATESFSGTLGECKQTSGKYTD